MRASFFNGRKLILFAAVYPRTYNPTYAIACCVMAVLLASTFTLIFPLVAPAAALLLILTLIGERHSRGKEAAMLMSLMSA